MSIELIIVIVVVLLAVGNIAWRKEAHGLFHPMVVARQKQPERVTTPRRWQGRGAVPCR